MAAPSQSSRHLRGFIRWMRENNVEYSEALAFHVGNTVADVGVKSQTDLHEGDVIATIPKQACLTVLTSEAREIIAEAEFGGGLGLAIALMYERSLGELSKWYGYLQLLPSQQCLPFVWTLSEIDQLLVGTELHKVIKEDLQLMKQDWRECYGILCDLYGEDRFSTKWFSLEQYLAAKTLVFSRAFEVDYVHGYGMVPLADLFNHKTADEDVHFTSVLSDSDSDAGSDSELDVDLDSDTDTKNQSALSLPHKNGEALKCRKRNKDSPQKRIEVENPAEVLSTPKKSPKKSKGKSQDKMKEKKLAEDFVAQKRDTGTPKKLTTGQNITEVTEGQKKTKVRRQIHTEDGNFKAVVLSPHKKDKHTPQKNMEKETVTETPKSQREKSRVQQIAVEEMLPEVHKSQEKDKHTPQKNMEKETVTETPKSQRKKSRVQQIAVEEMLPEVPKTQEKQKSKVQSPKQNTKEGITDGPSEEWEGSSEVLEMILVKDVLKGAEIYNTYGTLSNAALLHRYGFTEANNPFDIVNVELTTVNDVCYRLFTKRHVRRCVALWRKAGCVPCDSQGSEYFEITADGKPQPELLMLLYIMHLPDATRDKVEQETADLKSEMEDSDDRQEAESMAVEKLSRALGWSEVKSGSSRKRGRDTDSTDLQAGNSQKSSSKEPRLRRTSVVVREEDPSWLTPLDKWLLTKPVRTTLLAVLTERDGLYLDVNLMTNGNLVANNAVSALEYDKELLHNLDSKVDAKLYHALSLRVSERTILAKCASFVSTKLKKTR